MLDNEANFEEKVLFERGKIAFLDLLRCLADSESWSPSSFLFRKMETTKKEDANEKEIIKKGDILPLNGNLLGY